MDEDSPLVMYAEFLMINEYEKNTLIANDIQLEEHDNFYTWWNSYAEFYGNSKDQLQIIRPMFENMLMEYKRIRGIK